MPKERRINSSSLDRAMVSPYSRGSKFLDGGNRDGCFHHVGDERDWEETLCPICMEHPHNAVLLLCSSKENGCRPFICDTSYRHSNCFDQFRKSAVGGPSSQIPLVEKQIELVCPLCRGLVTGWEVVQPARRFMDSKARNCSLETCGFSGNYTELRKHARREHPSERPSEVSPAQKSRWTRLEQEREFEDAFMYQPGIDNDWEGWLCPLWDEIVGNDDLMNVDSFFDFPDFLSGMSDVEDAMQDEIFDGVTMSLFGFYPTSFEEQEEDIMESSLSRVRDRDSDARPNNHRGNNHRENGPTLSRSLPLQQRENIPSSRSNYHRGNSSVIPSPRNRENNSTHLTTGWAYSRENDSDTLRSRSSHQMENAPANSRTGSSYHGEEYTQPSSRARSYHRDEAATSPRRAATRHPPGSSRQVPSNSVRRQE